MSRRRGAGAMVGLAAVATVAGCGGGVRFAGQKIDSDVAFLGQIEQQFRDDATRGKANLGDGSHCWLLKDEDSGEIDSLAACGPIRRLGATESGVWDMYRFKGVVNGEAVSVDQVFLDRTGAALPADREPYRGDGAKIPDDADALAAPEAPAEKPGLARMVPGVTVENVAKPQKGMIVIPGAKVEVTEVGEVKTLPGEGENPVYRAADGEEFRAISVQVTEDKEWQSGDVKVEPAFSVKTGSQKTPVELTVSQGGGFQTPAGPQYLVVSVPKGEDAALVVSAGGGDQTLSVRTGERTSTNAAAYYRTNTKTAVNRQFPSQSFKKGDFEISHQVTFTEAEVTPFHKDAGWAPAGKSWVHLKFDNQGLEQVSETKVGYYAHTVNLAGGMSVVDDKGRRTAITRLTTLDPDYYGDTVSFQVADDAKWVDVSYGPVGTFSIRYASDDATPRSGSWAFKKMTFRIAIPQ